MYGSSCFTRTLPNRVTDSPCLLGFLHWKSHVQDKPSVLSKLSKPWPWLLILPKNLPVDHSHLKHTSKRILDYALLCPFQMDSVDSLPEGSVVKNLPANAGDAGDMGSIPWSRRLPRGGHGNLLQYACLENTMNRRTQWTTVLELQRVGHEWNNWALQHINKITNINALVWLLLISEFSDILF